ncbi:MAG: 2-amino-4-hydroxy-6-hydroxymethyldihydropteridine diphosphokinase [Ruminococcaceae bacterium]|nr:2-amino-4-hydroxy-6-hydroxymethyldihydropteridine diphosphokinase [Oscillospiraceae bacterium]
MKAVLCLGANLGDRGHAIECALDSINRLPATRLLRRSPVLETEPEGVPDQQPNYLNCVCEVETELCPEALLGACFGLEAAAGRIRRGFRSARTLDIDVLLYEGVTSDSPFLTLPHPRMLERKFVLVPLSRLYPDGRALDVDFSEALKKVLG